MSLGLVLTSLALGLRHGVDWDHIAAIADLSGTAENRRRGFVLSMLYALGHAAVVFGLGLIALVAGASIPEGVDGWMGRIVGITLIGLGAWILMELIRKRRDFRLRSRWMLILDGTFAGLRRVRAGFGGRRVSVDHEHEHEHGSESHTEPFAHDHAHTAAHLDRVPQVVGARLRASARSQHAHTHRHHLLLPDEAGASYGGGTAAGIGMLHGIGIESPTQIAIFVASTAVAGPALGVVLLSAWVVGLVVANGVLAAIAGAGLLHAERSYPVYAGLAIFVGAASIVMGALYLTGFDALPELL